MSKGTRVREYKSTACTDRCWNLRLAVWSCKCALDARRARGNICVIPKAKQVVSTIESGPCHDLRDHFRGRGYWADSMIVE